MRHRLLTTTFLLLLAITSQAIRPKIGLVLGGGGAKGAAEVGVLKVLEQAGIRPDIIVGTSIGSIVGGLYAAGYSAAELEAVFCQQEWISLLTDRREDLSGEAYATDGGVTYIFGFPVIDQNSTAFGVLRGERVEETIDSMLALRRCQKFENLPTPFRCVAASMLDAEEVVLRKGKLARAIRASIAIPGVFKPVKIDGQQLVDGGMMNNLPVDVAREMGATFVIAVDLQQDKPEMHDEEENIFIDIADLFGVGPLARWALYRPDIKKYHENLNHCDIYINPSMPYYDVTSFGNDDMKSMVRIGEQAALEQMDALRRLAGRQ